MKQVILEQFKRLEKMLGAPLHEISTEEIRKRYYQLGEGLRKQALTLGKKILKSKEAGLGKHIKIRMDAIDFLLAVLPESAEVIESILKKADNKYAYEVHFTFFVGIDDAYDLPWCVRYRKKMLEFIRDYLYEVRRNTAMAAWKAGETLGFHLKGKESREILLEATLEARYAAGREAAISGLGYIWRNKKTLNKQRERILKTWQDSALNDRSKKIRNSILIEIGLGLREIKIDARQQNHLRSFLKNVALNDRSESVRDTAELILEDSF